jgi:hypothetical protein
MQCDGRRGRLYGTRYKNFPGRSLHPGSKNGRKASSRWLKRLDKFRFPEKAKDEVLAAAGGLKEDIVEKKG